MRNTTKWIRGTFIALLAGVIITSCHSISSSLRDPHITPEWELVCRRVDKIYDGNQLTACLGLEAPIVIESSIVEDFDTPWLHFLGLHYIGEPYVFIRKGLDIEQRRKTILHEMGHYALANLKLVDDDDECEHERIVRQIAEEPWDKDARAPYGC